MTARTFAGSRSFSPRWWILSAGLAVLGVVGGVLVGTLGTGGERYLPWISSASAIGFFVAVLISMIPRRVSVTVDGTLVTASWLKRPFVVEAVALGRLVQAGVDTDIGVVAHLHGEGSHVRIAGTGHTGAGHRLDAPAVRSADCTITAAELDELLALFSVARQPTRSEIVVALTLNQQSARGLFTTMAPWIATIATAGIFGVTLGATGLGDTLSRTPTGRAFMTGVTVAIVVVGLAVTIKRSLRVKAPSHELWLTKSELQFREATGTEIWRAAWSHVRAVRQRYVYAVKGSRHTFPVLEITVADGTPPLRIGVWDSRLVFSGDPPRTRRSPRFLVGAPHWPGLIRKLSAHAQWQ